MNQKYIWLVTIVLCLSLFGLILLQIKYFQLTSQLKEEQFALAVSKALDQVVSKLEHDEEVQIFLKKGAGVNSETVISGSAKFIFSIPMDVTKEKASLSISHRDKKINIEGTSKIAGFEKFQKQFDNVLANRGRNYGRIAAKLRYENLDLDERLDLEVFPQLIAQKLKDNGIQLNFEYAVKVDNVKFEATSDHYFQNSGPTKFSKSLFPNDSYFSSSKVLYVYFPGQKRSMMLSYTMLLPSLILTLVLILCSAFTIYIIFRQKRLSKIKNDFINNMTHEFKTPISTISLASQMLKDNSVTTTPVFIDNISGIINDESKRLSFQIEKVLQMATFTEARMKMKLKTIGVHRIIRDLLAKFTLRVEDKNGNIYQNLDATEDLIVADELHISNVISNLLDNAIKYCKDAPEISISTRNTEKELIVSITDNGIGIAREDQKMIFERFFRVHTGNVHNVKGFGLGLSYVKNVVDAHHGEVKVESVPTKGSKFEVYLPLKKQKNEKN